jgi:hypothetical protein
MFMFAKKVAAKADAKLDEVDATWGGPGSGSPSAYGIDEAIALMRSLPTDQNMDLVVRVVKVTLGSLAVRFDDIIADATRKQQVIQENISTLHVHVSDLEKQLDARRREIAAQEADLKETTTVKERLLAAEKAGQRTAAAAAGSGARPRTPTPTVATGQGSGARALPRPQVRDESGEVPEILSEVDLSDLAPTQVTRTSR